MTQAKKTYNYEDILALFAQSDARFQAQKAETDALFAKTEAQMAKTDAKLDKLAKLYGNMSENQGAIAEEFFFNSLKFNPVVGNLRFDRVMSNVIIGSPSNQQEFDIVLVNGNSVAVLEVKQKIHLSALDQLEKQLIRYRQAVPEHANYTLYGGVAGLSVPKNVVEEAHHRGLFVLKQTGDILTVDAESMRAFQPM
ncbi:MAG: hypothetical protein RIR79_1855 [Pseudomonadota bacterium]|jgi:hypothetical protein